jgi:hypothetical protein
VSDASSVAVDPQFTGQAPTFFFLNESTGRVVPQLPTDHMATGSKPVMVSVSPIWLNAPSQWTGSNNETRFDNKAKPNAYVKLQLDQLQPDNSQTAPLTWQTIYPILTGAGDDVRSVGFSDPLSGKLIQNVTLPGGNAEFRVVLTALVGGQRTSPLFGILDKAFGILGSGVGTTVLPMIGAQLVLAQGIEQLLKVAATGFAPESKQQYWLNDNTVAPLQVVGPVRPHSRATPLPLGRFYMFAVPTGDNSTIADLFTKAAQVQNVSVNANGQLVANPGGVNPFEGFLYVTLDVEVAEKAST